MPGIKGQNHPVLLRTKRSQMWQTMRIKRQGFTVADLLITVPGASRDNIDHFLTKFSAHGIIKQIGEYRGGRAGSRKYWRLITDLGPILPDVCPYCKGKLTGAGCGGGDKP